MLGQNGWVYEIDIEWGKFNNSPVGPLNAHALVFVEDKLLLATDHPDHNIIEYNENGNVVDSWGRQWPGLHGIKTHVIGDKTHLFLVDSGWMLNRKWDGISVDKWDSPFNKMIPQSGAISKTTRDGKVLFTIGHPATYGAYKIDMPFNPTDVAVLDNGEFFVVDGYGSDYILHYNENGNLIKKFGQEGKQKICNGHGITIDYRSSEPLLLVSSRSQHSLMWYTLDGRYVRSLHVPGAFIHAPIFIGNFMVAPVCWTGLENNPEHNSGVICIFNESDSLISVLGGVLPDKGKMLKSDFKTFKHCHGLAKDKLDNLYLAEWNANGIHPKKLLRV
ncbi:6-bladed beta-propeller [Alteromonas macleodii]|uniref:6-bladed beta-propeller n=1 Tax=Alteromonas macleodii TaxID=28108 RepID=UPI00207667FD|nr:6-bladed beta-propeller [Alteromonas macleodii]USI26405.1 6-bladed beta-propeller [Alteromonas macleodii]